MGLPVKKILVFVCTFCVGYVVTQSIHHPHYSELEPAPPVRFFLYPDRWSPNYAQELITGDSKSLFGSKYNKWNFPVILVHGYQQNYSTNFPQLTKDAFLKKKINTNVIVVDWSSLATPLGYSSQAVSGPVGFPLAPINADAIGRKIAQFVVFLVNHGVLHDPTRVHIIGFSIGAQIAGISGQHIKKYTGKPIQRITGLDPAGPLFQYHPIKGKRLDHTDAYFVDVVHTNQGRYGAVGSSGHVDFYPNGGGPAQPGCTHYSDLHGLPGSCAHGRAWEYFTESILGTEIWACKAVSYKDFLLHKNVCSDKSLFGIYVSPSVRGSYFFDIVRHDPGFHLVKGEKKKEHISPALPVISSSLSGFEHPFGQGAGILPYKSQLSQLSQWIKPSGLELHGQLY